MSTSGFKAMLAHDTILEWIRGGRFQPGDQLPSERALARELALNGQTVRQALADLQQAGLIEKRPRVGNFVRRIRSIHAAPGIALMVPSYLFEIDSYPAVGMLLDGVRRGIDQHDYLLSTLVYRPEHFWLDAGLTATTRGVKGVLLRTHHEIRPADLDRVRAAGIEVVPLDFEVDVVAPLASILRRLTALGHRRIAVAHYQISERALITPRLLKAVAEQAGFARFPAKLLELPNTQRLDLEPLHALLASESRPTAIVVPDEMVASEVFRFCCQQGLQVPQDLSVAALFDHSPHQHVVALTAVKVSQASVEAVTQLTRQLVERIEAHAKPGSGRFQKPVLKNEVTWTESIGPAPVFSAASSFADIT